MEPKTDRERKIADAIDRKAVAIAEGVGNWGDEIVTEMKFAMALALSQEEIDFAERYTDWRRGHPI